MERGGETALIVGLVLGLLVVGSGSWYFRTQVYGAPAPFTEIYFNAPSDLPEQVRIGDRYDYSFVVKSHETEPKNISISYGTEIYELYDEIEEQYSCLSRYRVPTWLRWQNATEPVSWVPQTILHIPRMQAPPNGEVPIVWDRYSLEIRLPPTDAVGRLIIFFADEDKVKYRALIDEQQRKVVLNDQGREGGFDLTDDNNVIRIIADRGNVSLEINKRVLLSVPVEDFTGGSFGFESQDDFYGIERFTVRQLDAPLVPDTGQVREFRILTQALIDARRLVLGLRSRTVPLGRRFEDVNYTVDCDLDPFYCSYFDIPNDIRFYVNDSIGGVVDRIPIVGQDISYVYYALQQNQSLVNWTNFSISFEHTQLPPGSAGHIIVKFSEKWAIMITRNNSYWLRPLANQTAIDEIRNPIKVEESTDRVRIEMDRFKIRLLISNQSVFERATPDDFTDGNIEVYIKNTFINIPSISIQSGDPRCLDPFASTYCELLLQSAGRPVRPQVQQQQEDFRIDTRTYSTRETSISIVNQNGTQRESYQIPILNPYIPDTRFVFNTPGTRFDEVDRYSVDYSYNALDGARVMEIGILDEFDNVQVAMYAFEKEDRVITYWFDGQHDRTFKFSRPINLSLGHQLGITAEGGDITFTFDYRELYTMRRSGVTSGVAFIGARNTYAEFGNVHIKRGNVTRSLEMPGDPCELRQIYRREQTKEVELGPGEALRLRNDFTVTGDFDFGKVFVELGNESIYFWVVRDDS